MIFRKERWRDVPGYEGLYQVSARGRVRSLPRATTSGRVLKLGWHTEGYPQVTLSAANVKSRKLVHRLVMAAFKGECPEGKEVCHNDGDHSNARLWNLRYDTRSGNHADKEGHGTLAYGERCGKAKLKNEDIDLIRLMVAAGHTKTEIGNMFGVGRTTIFDIVSGKSWSKV